MGDEAGERTNHSIAGCDDALLDASAAEAADEPRDDAPADGGDGASGVSAVGEGGDVPDEPLDDDDDAADTSASGDANERLLIPAADDAGKRLDVFLAERLTSTRSHAARLIEAGRVSPGGKAGRRVAPGERIVVAIPAPTPLDLVPEDIALDILYEDGDILVLNKPVGLVVHPAAGNETGTLVQALLHHCGDLSGINGALRPGIVHRLDKDTSGALVVAKNDAAHASLAAQIQDRTMKRTYWALVQGHVREACAIDAPIGRHPTERKRMAVVEGGRRAVTHVRVVQELARATWVECALETGRTHQIRVHMRHIGHPVLGDPTYGTAQDRKAGGTQMLHAVRLQLVHPRTGERMAFRAEPPQAWVERLVREGGRLEDGAREGSE